MDYRRRNIDLELDELMPDLAAIAIDGPKGVGKTETARRRAAAELPLDQGAVRAVVEAEPSTILNRARPLLIDEWQLVPEVWDVVRRAVDGDNSGGQFLLTGSASERPGVTMHSGAGRIVRLRMRPMTLEERQVSQPTVSLGRLLSGNRDRLSGECELKLEDYVDELLASGFPGIRGLASRAQRIQLDGYLRGVVDRDVPDSGLATRKPDVLLSWLRSYAAASSTSASYSSILDAATPGESNKPAKTTTIAYRDALTRLWLLDPIPGWIPSSNHFARLQRAPKHQLADPALAARLLDVTRDTLLSESTSAGPKVDGALLGRLFESLATLCVRVPAQAAEATVGHLRTGNGSREVDLVVTGVDGQVVAIEVKLGGTINDHDVRHLLWLKDRLGSTLVDAIVLTTGPQAYRRADGIGVVPLGLLGV